MHIFIKLFKFDSSFFTHLPMFFRLTPAKITNFGSYKTKISENLKENSALQPKFAWNVSSQALKLCKNFSFLYLTSQRHSFWVPQPRWQTIIICTPCHYYDDFIMGYIQNIYPKCFLFHMGPFSYKDPKLGSAELIIQRPPWIQIPLSEFRYPFVVLNFGTHWNNGAHNQVHIMFTKSLSANKISICAIFVKWLWNMYPSPKPCSPCAYYA